MRPLTDLRAVLDAFAARQAAERVAGGAKKQPLLAAFKRLQQAAVDGNHRSMAAADRRLHETIVRLADVPGLDASWQAAADANEPFHRDTLARCWPDLTTLSFLAEHVARTSPGHLARLFREKRQTTFSRYLRDLRLHRAVGLLTATAESVGRIARLVGLPDPSRFALHFRRRYGLTPRAYRARYVGRG